MTTEELLKPRYKVIADYPKSLYIIGSIINAGTTSQDCIYCDHEGPRMRHYPHLFKPLQWWEERKPDDMPEYVRCIKTPDQTIMPGMVLKVEWKAPAWGESGKHVILPYTRCYEPVSKEDYDAYLLTPLTS